MQRTKMLFVVITITFCIGFIFSLSRISNANNIDILTKTTIFDIIDDVEDVIITCISADGQKSLDAENKMDSTLLYIINHKEKYTLYELSNLDLNEEKVIIGKVNLKDFEIELKRIFANFKHKISEYKYCDGDYINLVYEPCDFFRYDEKQLIYARHVDNVYEIVYKYKRMLNDVENDINVKYVVTETMKIKDVIILSSNVR